MCDTGGLRKSKSLRRVNSGEIDFDTQSEFIAGNVNLAQFSLEPLAEDPDFSDSEEEDELATESFKTLTLEDYSKANSILSDIYGVNVIELATKYILSGKLNSLDMVVQALSYKIQKMSRGSSKAIRYLPSWGCFWASVREIVKARGLVPFLDHFEVKSLFCFASNPIII